MVENIVGLIEELSEDPVLKSRCKLCLCRIWTDRVLDLVRGPKYREHELTAAAREVQIEAGLFHTFVQLTIGNQKYLWDGVGTVRYKPYFGLEKEAPEYLRNSYPDIINSLRN